MADETEIGTADTMRERAGESRLKLWIMLSVDRLLLTGVLTAFVFVAFVLLVDVLSPPFAQQVESGDIIGPLFTTMIVVIVTGVTFVVTIGQLILTQETGPLGDQHERMSRSMDVREYTDELIGPPIPGNPAALLSELIATTKHRSVALREAAADSSNDAFREDAEAFTGSVIGNADTVRDQLDGAQFGSFDAVDASLNFNYGKKILQVERLQAEYPDLDEHEQRLLDDLKGALSLFGPAREHIKTLYFQWALIDLSQLILYAAVPALTVAGIVAAVVDAGTFPGSTFGIANITLVVGAAFALTLVPFLLFVSYLLRILTVAKRTLAIEPLILRDTDE